MPIYEYACSACGHRMDAWQKMSDEPLSECPGCHASSLRKLMSAPGINLMGGREQPEPRCGTGACPACIRD